MKNRLKYAVNPMISVLLITAAWFVVYTSSQMGPQYVRRRPEKCIGHPDILNKFCCAMPPFFTKTIAKKCGGATDVLDEGKFNISMLKRYSYSCRYWYCVLDQYALIDTTSTVNHEKFFSHLDLWVTLNPSFTDVMIEAKLRCKQVFRYYLPLRICDFFQLNMCVRNYINVYCPVPFPGPECEQHQKFFKECGSYFV